MLEVHDCTGHGEKPEAFPLVNAVNYWLAPTIREELIGQEAYVIVNIANEAFGTHGQGQGRINGGTGPKI